MEQMIRMFMRTFMRRAMQKGIDKGIDMAVNGGRDTSDLSLDERNNAQRAKNMSHEVRSAARAIRTSR